MFRFYRRPPRALSQRTLPSVPLNSKSTTVSLRLTLAGLSLVATFILAGIVLVRGLSQVELKVEGLLDRWQKQIGTQVEIAESTVGLNSLRLKDIKLHGNLSGTVLDAKILMGFDPASKSFLKPASIKVDGADMLLKKSSLFRSLGPRTLTAELMTRPASASSWMDSDVELSNSRISLSLGSKNLNPFILVFALDRLVWEARRQQVDLEVERVSLGSTSLANKIEGSIWPLERRALWHGMHEKGAKFSAEIKWAADRRSTLIETRMGKGSLGLSATGKDTLSYSGVRWKGRAVLDSAGRLLELDGNLFMDDVALDLPLLASSTVNFAQVRAKLSARVDLSTGRLWLSELTLGLPDQPRSGLVQLWLRGEAMFEKSGPSPWQLEARLPLTRCASLLSVLPPALSGDLQQFHWSGSAAATLLLSSGGTLADLEARLSELNFDCKIHSPPELYSVERLQRSNAMQSGTLGRKILAARSDQSSPNFVPFAKLSPYFVKAVVTAEDIGFWQHRGFSWQNLVRAFKSNFDRGRIAFGGSTISMQTAKNLFLSHERTGARKFQEAILTWHLEQSLTKQRIFEIYSNIVEFGPELFGIKAAANYYFGKDPSQLELKEAVFLASLLPSPIKRHQYYCKGVLSEDYRVLIDQRLRTLLASNSISFQDHELAQAAPLHFQYSDNARLQCGRDLMSRRGSASTARVY